MAVTDYDAFVGSRIKLRRMDISMSQADLADRIGITYQQLQKYERAKNRITAGRLIEIANALGVPITYFYDGLQQQFDAPADTNVYKLTSHLGLHGEMNFTRQSMLLQQHFLKVRDNSTRNKIVQLVASIAESERDEDQSEDRS